MDGWIDVICLGFHVGTSPPSYGQLIECRAVEVPRGIDLWLTVLHLQVQPPLV